MAIVNANRVRENTTGNGTGALALLGAVTNYQTFLSGVGNGNQCYYAITHQSKNEWEVGLGTFTLSAGIPYLSRNVVYNSSNGNLLVDFTAGTKQCAVVYPGTQIDTIASNVGVAAGYANDANTYAQLASVAAVNANIYRVSAAAEASLAGTYAAAASVSYVNAASAAAQAASLAAQVSSVATEASIALVAASLAQIYKTSASAYATEAGGYASVAQIYKVSASAYATDAANQASIAGVAAVSANNAASIAGAYANTASIAAVSANNAASIAGVYAHTASVAAVSANNAASIANVAANNASIAAVSANNAASLAGYYAGLINPSTYAALAGTNTFTGNNTFTSVVHVQSNLSVTGNAFVSGVTTLASAVDIKGATSLASTLVTNGIATFNSNVSVSGSFLVSGVTTLASAVDIKGATSLASTLLVNGNATFNSNISGSGTFTVLGVTTLFGAANLRSTTSVGGTLLVNGNATFNSNVSVSGTFTVSGVANLLSAVNLRGNTSVGGTLITTGNATFAGLVSVSGVMVVGAGAVGAPSYSTTGDTNTGIYFPAADTIAVATSAVERMRITSAGLVGIGTNSPNSNALLTNNGNIAIAAPTRNQATSNQVGVWTSDDPSDNGRAAITIGTVAGGASSNSYIAFTTNNYGVDRAERMRIDNAGNVGIGTSSPTFKFVAANSGTDGGWLYSSGAISILGLGGYSGATDGASSIRYDRSTGAITINGGNRDTPAERMRITSSGLVGIGTSSPDYPLTVQSTGDAQFSLKNSSGTTKAYIGTAGIFGGGSTDDLRIRSEATNIIFGFSGTEKMRLASSGNVGIGTASPGQKLTVAGTVESTSGGFKFPDGTTQSTAASGGVLTGTILDYGGITAPSGYLFCDGSAVSRTTYATLWATLNANSTVTITIASPGVVTWTSHPLQNGDPIRLQTTGALPTGLTANTTYYVVSAAANTFSLATSRGGTAINTSGTQSGTHTAIYAPWGWGDNSTTFNVPDLRGRSNVGRDNMGGTAASRITTAGSGISGVNLGDAGGSQTVTLTTTEMPAHTHTVPLQASQNPFSCSGGSYVLSGGSTTSGSTGGGGAHQNTQPSAIVNKIIKT